MDGQRIARRSVAFFLIKSGVNFLAVAVLGAVMALGLLGLELSLWLTAFPAVMVALELGGVVAIPRLGPPAPSAPTPPACAGCCRSPVGSAASTAG